MQGLGGAAGSGGRSEAAMAAADEGDFGVSAGGSTGLTSSRSQLDDMTHVDTTGFDAVSREDAWAALRELQGLVSEDAEGMREFLGKNGRVVRGLLEAAGSLGILRAVTGPSREALEFAARTDGEALAALQESEEAQKRGSISKRKGPELPTAPPNTDAALILNTLAIGPEELAQFSTEDRMQAQSIRWAFGADSASLETAGKATRDSVEQIRPGLEDRLRAEKIDPKLVYDAVAAMQN